MRKPLNVSAPPKFSPARPAPNTAARAAAISRGRGGEPARDVTRESGFVQQRASAEARNRRIVYVLVAVFIVGAATAMAMGAASISRSMATKRAIASTLARAQVRQTEFRSVNGRFASWTELQQNGEVLGPRQVMAASRADASHWFMSIRDSETGMVCDHIGELFDDVEGAPTPKCRN